MKIRILYIYIVIFFASCNEKNNDEKQIFRYNEHSNISSLDPAFARTQSNIWAVNQLFTGCLLYTSPSPRDS